MTTGEFVTSAIAALSLIVSLLTAYLTLMSGFRGTVLPKRRVALTQVDGVPCLVLQCEFVNDGARAGSIEDVLVKLTHLESGSQFVFVPNWIREQFSIFQNYQMADFTVFSGISLGARQRRELYVFFKPNQAKFDPPTGTITLRTSICGDNKWKKWSESSILISLNIDQDIAARWASPAGSPQLILAREIGRGRQEFVEHQR
ncbi:MAG: hypothetical protein FJ009_22250 [Chloroflexi bacterium]|jgi:hypothetical protein|nr:hypothetical protein [Chloroflexota bacterium]